MKKIIILFTLVITLLLISCGQISQKKEVENPSGVVKPAKTSETNESYVPRTFAYEFPDRLFRIKVLGLINEQDGGNRSDSMEISAQDFSFIASIDKLDLAGFNHKFLDLAVEEFAYRKDRGIASLRGIEYFSALKELDCSNNQLKELDLSKNTELISLCCINNQLEELELARNLAIEVILCDENSLAELNLSKNNALRELGCYSNKLTELDLSKNTGLEVLNCYNNRLTELDLSKNTALEVLNCSYNQLTELDLSRNTALEQLDCSQNYLKSIDTIIGLKKRVKVYFELQRVDAL